MIIGTIRAEEARVFDDKEGYHQFHAEETQVPFGSFEVFWSDGQETDGMIQGWYWWACHPGRLTDGDPTGPFATSRQAHQDADEWSPEYNEE